MKEKNRVITRQSLMMFGAVDRDGKQDFDDETYYKGVADGLARALTVVKQKSAEYRKREKAGKPITTDGALRSITRAIGEQQAAYEGMTNPNDGAPSIGGIPMPTPFE